MANLDETSPALQRRDPLGTFDLLRPGMLHRFMADPWAGSPVADSTSQTLPAVDVSEGDEAYVVTAELAGCKPEDVTVEVHEGVLSIRGEKRSERTEEKEQARWTERRYGSFHRSFRLPADVNEEAVEAAFNDGVLSVTIKKLEETKPRVVNIQT
jgi:HSP20 family protein